jgi:hypothetical protein
MVALNYRARREAGLYDTDEAVREKAVKSLAKQQDAIIKESERVAQDEGEGGTASTR